MPRPSHRAASHRGRPPLRERWAPAVALLVVAVAVPVGARVANAGPGESPDAAVDVSSADRELGQETASAEPSATPTRSALARRVDRAGKPVPGQRLVLAPEPKRTPEPKKEKRKKKEEPEPAPFEFRIGTFNVLGSQHTGPGGPRSRYPAASWRTPQAAALAARHGVDVLGTQELQADQLNGLMSRTGMAAYPGYAWGQVETDNSILYDPGVFELVSGDSFSIVFMDRARPQPIARLRHLETGQELYVVNTHPSPGGGRYLAQRRRAQATLVSVVNSLEESGLPVLVTGDMNDRQEFYCQVAPASGITAPNGGSTSGGCRPPPSPLPVDWVAGIGVTWSGYWRDTTPVNRRISDHFFISATAHVE